MKSDPDAEVMALRYGPAASRVSIGYSAAERQPDAGKAPFLPQAAAARV